MPRCDIIYKLRVSSRFQRPEKSSPVFAFPYRLQETERQSQGEVAREAGLKGSVKPDYNRSSDPL